MSETMMQREDSPTTQENYHAFLMVLPIPVMVMEADRTISFINPAFEKIFGWTLEEIKGRPLDFIPEDQIQKTATGKARLITTGRTGKILKQSDLPRTVVFWTLSTMAPDITMRIIVRPGW